MFDFNNVLFRRQLIALTLLAFLGFFLANCTRKGEVRNRVAVKKTTENALAQKYHNKLFYE